MLKSQRVIFEKLHVIFLKLRDVWRQTTGNYAAFQAKQKSPKHDIAPQSTVVHSDLLGALHRKSPYRSEGALAEG